MTPLRRADWLISTVLLLTVGLLVALAGRVMWIERHVTPADLAKINAQTTAVQTDLSGREAICDSAGNFYALSVRMYNLFADPGYILDPEGKLNSLKDADLLQARKQLVEALQPLLAKVDPEQLQFAPDELQSYLNAHRTYTNGKPRRFLWLAREVDAKFYDDFQALKQKLRDEAHEEAKTRDKDKAVRTAAQERARILYHTLDGVGFAQSFKRLYPMGALAGPVIGFANQYEGVDGLERLLDDLLHGHDGRMLTVKDAGWHTLYIQDQTYHPADDGRRVWLTLDTIIQGVADEELTAACTQYKAASGVAIVMDPFNGRILAMADWPPFDPSHYRESNPSTRRNMAVTDPYEPGSIFKPFILAWALQNHVVRRTDVFNCHNGRYYDPTGRLVTDTHGYGALRVEDILIESSNIGMTQIGWKMGIPTLHEAVRTFGFGDRTGVELPGDQKGLVHPLTAWNKGTLTSVSFGYEVAATPMQLVRGFATFANNGTLITPHIMHAVEDRPGHVVPWQELAGPSPAPKILSADTCATMRDIMEGVYLRGTAKKKGSLIYRFFGKTGTAHLAVHGAKHYASDEYNSSFLAGGPVTSPRLVVVVTLHKPDRSLGHFGGTVAAPAATKILERALLYMQVPGDQKPETRQIPTDPLAGL